MYTSLFKEATYRATLPKIYALYQQATKGNNATPALSFSDNMVARSKWDAWDKLKTKPASNAKQQHIALINSLR